MIVLEFLAVSVVGGSLLALALRKYDNWRADVQARALEDALKDE